VGSSFVTDGRRGLAKAATLIAAGNIASRLLGLARDTVIAGLFGATGAVSAYRTAEFVPRQFYDLLVGGMISSALVPVFSEYVDRDRRVLWRAAGLVLSLAVVALGGAVALAELAAPQIAWLLGGTALDLDLLARLLRLTIPAMLFLSLSGIVTGLLYALRRFVYPAFTAAVFNAAIVAVTLTGAWLFKGGVEVVALGLVAGSVAQIVLQLPGLRGAGLRFQLDVRHPVLRRIGRLYRPVILGLVVTLLQTSLDRRLANTTGESSLAWMQNATTLIQFPIGLVSAAISLAILPTLSRYAARAVGTGRNSDANRRFADTLFSGLKVVLILIIPAAVAQFILAEPVIRLLFEHGRFSAFDTAQTALALRFYLLGLIFAAVDQPLIFAFYARQNTFTPAMVGVAAVGVYLIAALGPLRFRPLHMTDLVLADSIKHMSHVAMMLWLIRRWGPLCGRGLEGTALKAAAAAAAMGLALWGGRLWLAALLPPAGLLNEALLVGALAVAGGGVYAAGIWALKVEEVGLLTGAVKNRLNRAGKP
ncbi:MAG: murein biosynthesis integral membrane protein MurJ, partial [Anaerolineae bacterium]